MGVQFDPELVEIWGWLVGEEEEDDSPPP